MRLECRTSSCNQISTLLERDDRGIVVRRRNEAQQRHACRRDRADSQTFLEILRILALVVGVTDDARHRVEGVARLALGLSVGALLQAAILAMLIHVVGVSVVRGDDHDATGGLHGFPDASNLDVHALHGTYDSFEDAGMADHVSVGEVEFDEVPLAALDLGDDAVGDLGALHPGSLLEGDDVARNLDVVLKLLVELASPVAVEEVGHVAELLRLGDGELPDAAGAQVLRHRPVDRRGIDQVLAGDMEVTVVLHHAGVLYLGMPLAVELGEVLSLEGLGDLEGAVAAEVEEDDGVAVVDGSHRLAVLRDDEGRQVLVDGAGLLTQRRDGVVGVVELAALSEDVGLPALADHVPVGVVAVHRDDHPATAGGDACVEAVIAQLAEEVGEGVEVVECAHLAHITAIQQCVDANLPDAFLLGLEDHGLEVVDVGVDIAVGQQTDEVERTSALLDVSHEVLPGLSLEDLSALDRLADQGGTLVEDASAAHGVVADLTVAHVGVGRQSDSQSVGLELRPGVGRIERVEMLRHGGGNRVAILILAETDTVHDDEDHRSLPVDLSVLLQGFYHIAILPCISVSLRMLSLVATGG